MRPEAGSPKTGWRTWSSHSALAVAYQASPFDGPTAAFMLSRLPRRPPGRFDSRNVGPPKIQYLGLFLDLLPSDVSPPPSAEQVADLSRLRHSYA